jgi:hypothetical protein
MTFCTSLFKNSNITSVERSGPSGPDPEGTVRHAVFRRDGQEYTAIDSARGHDFMFTGPCPSSAAITVTRPVRGWGALPLNNTVGAVQGVRADDPALYSPDGPDEGVCFR